MKAISFTTAAFGVVLLVAAASGSSSVASGPFGNGSRIWLDGTSTLRSFSCDVTAFDGNVQARAGVRAFDAESLQGAVESARLTVATSALDCRNGTMNDHMRKALKADANPQIAFRMTNYEVLPGEGDQSRIRARGQLSMAGQTKQVTLEGTASSLGNGAVQFTGSYPITMTEWGMRPPSLMLGTIRVGNRITVNYDVIVRP